MSVAFVSYREWIDLRSKLEELTDPPDNGEAWAWHFMDVFEPERASEWGHIAYCIRYAIEMGAS